MEEEHLGRIAEWIAPKFFWFAIITTLFSNVLLFGADAHVWANFESIRNAVMCLTSLILLVFYLAYLIKKRERKKRKHL
jgi:membrane protein DedA with SNARE-associated domain